MTTVRDIATTFGLTMLDAAKPIDIEITKKDIAGAKAHNQSECAIARAVRRQYQAKEAYVLRSTVWVNDGEHLTRYSIPPSLQKEIVSFDRSGDFRPGSFHLGRAPNKKRNVAQKAGKQPQKKARAKRQATAKPKRQVHRTEGCRSSDLDRF